MNKFEESISEIINDFLSDHEEDKKANGAKIFNHPDKEVIIDILTSLRKVIFPGYFRNRSIKVYTLRNNLSMLIEDIIYKLTKQITIVLGSDDPETAEEDACKIEHVISHDTYVAICEHVNKYSDIKIKSYEDE